MVWYGLALGAVVGGDSGNSAGGAATGDKDKKGAQGLFSIFGHQVWLYFGGMMGWGESAGVYLTTGPMIGYDLDWAVGGGVHIGKKVGLGIVLPIRQMLQARPDLAAYAIDQGQYLLASAQYYAAHAMQTLPSLGGLEQLITG